MRERRSAVFKGGTILQTFGVVAALRVEQGW
jgi:hypothetical protein